MAQNGQTVTAHNGVKVEAAHHSYGGAAPGRAVTPGGHPMDPTQPGFPVFHRKFANPAPLGLMAFATTTFVLSFFNTGSRGITEPNFILCLAFGYGGLVQLLAGMWEFAAGNTFGATAFSSYGGFWLSFGLIFWPGSGITTQVYVGEAAAQLDQALGFYLIAWFIVTFIFLIACLRSSAALISVFFFLTITFILLAAHFFLGNAKLGVAGGAFGIITAFAAYYTALAGLLTPETSFFMLPIGPMGPKD